MRAELLAFILADPAVAALCGEAGVSWLWRKPGTPLAVGRPIATLTRTDANPSYTYDGPDGWAATFVQLDCYGALVADADQLETAILARLGTAREANTGGVVQGVFVEHGSDEFEGDQPDRVFRLRTALKVTHAT